MEMTITAHKYEGAFGRLRVDNPWGVVQEKALIISAKGLVLSQPWRYRRILN